ncbi:uncharacterized protein LOC110427598 [Herrania umbratica]|uniref:Uncharacterized protein LOC110427598 n=1 Tax=Herrania umbratica TaxID=108875 RepID=A0A6J1BHQ9_9ROSI|nr:uncharacterized protein LOC110427598 [Herrania umbratica]
MAMGGVSHKRNGNSNRGRPYGLMLLVAFGAALLGVMVLHKLRERRIFNLLVEDKNRQLISLQLLLQKEREYTKEMKREAEETKAKIYFLRNQKMELDHRLLEMQSAIDSLKDEQKTMESALEEKQNEIIVLQEKHVDSGKENPQVLALTATLEQKEAEIEVLKHRLKSPVRVWSVSTDDKSNLPVNVTVTGSMEEKEKTEFSQEEGGRVHESTAYKDGDDSTKDQDRSEIKFNFSQEEHNGEEVEDGSKKKGETTFRMDMAGAGQLQKPVSLEEKARNEGAAGEMGNEYSQYTGTSRMNGEMNHANATETINDMDEQGLKITNAGQLGELKNPRPEGESQKLQGTYEGGRKLGIDDNSRISGLSGRFDHLSRAKGKRWRILARNRFLKKNVNSELDGVASMRSRRFSKADKDEARSSEGGVVSNEGKAEREATEAGMRKEMDLTKVNFLKRQNSEDTEDVKQRKVSAETSREVEGENAMSRYPDKFLAREVPEKKGVNAEASNYTHHVKQLKVEEAASHIKQNMKSREVKELEKKPELNPVVKDDMEEDTEVADKQEPETEAANGDLSSDFMSDSEEKEGYKEETDESEF